MYSAGLLDFKDVFFYIEDSHVEAMFSHITGSPFIHCYLKNVAYTGFQGSILKICSQAVLGRREKMNKLLV